MRRSDPPIAADGGGNRPGRMRPRTGQAQPPAVPFSTCVDELHSRRLTALCTNRVSG